MMLIRFNSISIHYHQYHPTFDPPTVLVALVSEYLDTIRVDTDYTTSCLKDKGILRGAGRKSNLRGPSRRISN